MSSYNYWRTPVTDRTWADVQSGHPRGRYTNDDINRVEWNSGYLAERLWELPTELAAYRESKGIPDDPRYYPDYGYYDPGVYWLYEPYNYPPQSISDPIATMLSMVGETAEYPADLNRLNYIGANNLELAQIKILAAIDMLRAHYMGLIDEDSYTVIHGGSFADWDNENELIGGVFDPWENPGEISGGKF